MLLITPVWFTMASVSSRQLDEFSLPGTQLPTLRGSTVAEDLGGVANQVVTREISVRWRYWVTVVGFGRSRQSCKALEQSAILPN